MEAKKIYEKYWLFLLKWKKCLFFNEKSVTIILHIENQNHFYKITYIINASIYKKYVRYIESSIGSIKSLITKEKN